MRLDTSRPRPAQAGQGERPRPRWPAAVAAAVLAAVVLAIFLPIVSFQFTHYDDDKQVIENLYIRSLRPGNVWWIFTHFCITSYYPVRLLSFAVDHHFWGLDPTGYHLTNVLLHAANVLMVFWLLLRIKEKGPGPLKALRVLDPFLFAAVAAAIFAIHPVVVEPVAWIPGREELLMTLFALLCLHFHRSAHLANERGEPDAGAPGHIPRRSRVGLENRVGLGNLLGLGYHALAAAACAAAAMSNAVGVAAATLVLAYDVAVARPKGRRAVIAAAAGELPLWAVGIGAVIVKEISESMPLAVASAKMAASVAQLPWQHRAAIILDGFRLNVLSLVRPQDLTPFYPRSGPESVLSLGPMIGLALGLASLAAIWFLRRERTALLGVLWFLVALAPTSQIIPHHIFRADRFLYLPLAGLVLAVGAGLAYLAARKEKGPGPLKSSRVLDPFLFAAGLSLAAVAALTVVTLRQVPLWKDGLTIFGHAALVTPDNTDAHHALGTVLSQADRTDEAITEYREAIRLDPASAVALHSLGCALVTKGNAAEAIRAFEDALRVGPDSAETHNNLGVAWLAAGNIEEAVRQYREALRLQPDNADAWNNLGVAAYRNGDAPEAVRCFREAIRLNPSRAESYRDLGLALIRQGDLPGALRAYEDMLRLRPADPEAHYGYAMALARLGRLDEAERSLRKAIEVGPRFAQAYDRLGLVLLRRGDFAGAAARFEQAVRLSPNEPRPIKNLARLLATCPEGALRSGPRAVALAEQAWRMTGSRDPDCLDTLAAAYAEAGRFDEAVAAAQKVIAMAEETHRPELIEVARKRLALYQSRMPLREGPPR